MLQLFTIISFLALSCLGQTRETFTITAHRIPTALHKVAHSLTVIQVSDLPSSDRQSLLQAIESTTGVHIAHQGGFGKNPSVFVRGTEPSHILVLVDGVEINDPLSPSRKADLSQIPFAQVERIEILKGPQSALYGSDAMGGVIHFITQKRKTNRTHIFLQLGSFDTKDIRLNTTKGGERFQTQSSISFFSTSSFSSAHKKYGNTEKDGLSQFEASFRASKKWNTNNKTTFFLQYIENKVDLDQGGGPNKDDPNSTSKDKKTISQIKTESFLSENFESLFTIDYGKTIRDYDNPSDPKNPEPSHNSFKGDLLKLSWQGNYFFNNENTFILGLEYKKDSGNSSSFSLKETETKSFFTQYKNDYGSFFSSIGLRWDNYSKENINSQNIRLSSGYFFENINARLYTSWGTGFKIPSLSQLYDPEYGNEKLKPEQVRSFDVSFEQSLFQENQSLKATYFKNYFSNLISYDPSTFKPINIDQSEISGLEFSFFSQLIQNWSLSAQYTHFFLLKNKTSGEDLLRRPKQSWNLNIRNKFSEFIDFSINYRQVGKREDLHAQNFSRTSLPQYEIIDFTTSVKWNTYKGFIRFENLLDTEYEEVHGYGTSPLAIYIGLKAMF